MQHQGQLHRVLDGADQLIGVLGREDPRHVLYADGAHAHALHLPGHLHILVQRVDGTGGVGYGAGGHGPALHRLFYCHLKVVQVVQGVKNTDDVYAVFHGGTDKTPHHIIAVVLVAQNVLPSQQHLQLGIGHLGPYLTQTLPGVLVEKAQAHVEGGSAPALHRVEAGLVHLLQYPLKLLVGQPSWL